MMMSDLPPTDRPLTAGDLPWIRPMAEALAGYEADYGEGLDDMHELGCIEDSRATPSFRIRVGHVRALAEILHRPATSAASEGELSKVDAIRAVDACGGTYSRDEERSGYADGHREALTAALSALAALASPPVSEREREFTVRTGNLWWNSEDWETTFDNIEDAYDAATQGSMRGIAALGRATQHDTVFAVRIDIDTTGDGDADDYEIRLFPTREALLTAQPAGEGK